jgi:hypothetical protein
VVLSKGTFSWVLESIHWQFVGKGKMQIFFKHNENNETADKINFLFLS